MINSDSFKDWWQFLSLSLPSMLMTLIEGSSFELLTIYAGLLGVDELGANTIIANITFVVYMISVGIALTASSLIGKELGSGNYTNAKQLFYGTYLLAVVTSVAILFVAVVFTEQILHLYTYNAEVITRIYPALFPVIILMCTDNVQG